SCWVVERNFAAFPGVESPESGRRLLSPRALHYGVWEVPISENLPLQSSRFFNGKRSLWKRVRRTISDAGTFHLIINAPAVAEAGQGTEKTITWLAKRIALLRDRGMIQVETMRSMSSRLSDVP